MLLLDYLKLIKRRWKAIVLIVAFAAVMTSAFALIKNKNIYKATIFLSIGVYEADTAKTSPKNSIYENVQAADQFTETVQGWFKNPNFLQRIEEKTGTKISISAHKQEKQNLVVTFSNPSKQQAQKMGEVIQIELTGELNTYNKQTNTAFQLAIFGLNVNEEQVNLPLFIILGLFAGFALGIGIVYVYEYILKLSRLSH